MGDPCHKLTFSRKVGSGLKEIKLSNAKDLVTRGFDVVPGQKLCPSCTIRMNETKNDPIHAAEPDEAFEEDFDKGQYCRPEAVDVIGASTTQRTFEIGTQHVSALLGHEKDRAGK
eukprot:gene9729-biopygen2692